MEGWNGTLKTEWLYHPDNRYHKNLLTLTRPNRKFLNIAITTMRNVSKPS